jgi:hypothetical protein
LNFSVEYGLAQSSRKDAKKEIEARNPNIKVRNNFQTMKDKTHLMFQTRATRIGVLNFPSFGFIRLRFVSDLVLRISGFA